METACTTDTAALVGDATMSDNGSGSTPCCSPRCALVGVLIVLLTVLVNMWLATSELARLSGCLGVPIALTLAGWWALAEGLHSTDTTKDVDVAGWLYYFPAVPSACTAASFLSVILGRVFRPVDGAIFTPLLGHFFLAFCAVSALGCLLASGRCACWRHRSSIAAAKPYNGAIRESA